MWARFFLGIALAISAMILIAPVAAHAQATRTWVSGVGDDANPCSRTAPCKTFPGAISKTAAKGEINCLDPGGFGAVTITKSISIVCGHTEGGVLASLVNGIIVNLPNASDKVLLQGLDIEGVGNGLNGIRMIGTGNLVVRNTLIRNFTGNGIDVKGTAGARVVVEDSQINNSAIGVDVLGQAGAANAVFLQRTTLDSNATNSVRAQNAVNSIGLFKCTLIGTTNAINSVGGAPIVSFGQSNVVAGATAPTSTVPLK
ncbi:MAG: hypothetical protein HYS63_07225 [Methylocystis sp.]|nr:hypothetical protein [Methylocystis sp.]